LSEQDRLTSQIVDLLPRLRRFALTLTRHEDDGDDLVQATVERALTKLDRWDGQGQLHSWLFKVMQNLWIDQVRSRTKRGHRDPDFDMASLPGEDGRQTVEHRSQLAATMAAVMDLPDEQRAVVGLVLIEGLSYRDAADILRAPIGTVMSRLARARLAIEKAVTSLSDTHRVEINP
jgi:RNA polymerase sigma-70 factor (ECF subfamily)